MLLSRRDSGGRNLTDFPIFLLNRFIVDHHAPGAGTVVTSSSGGQSERKLRLGCASRLPLPTGDREEGIKPEFFGCRCNRFSQLRDKGKHNVFNLKQKFQYFSKTTINFVLDFLKKRISRRFYENFNWISFSILTDLKNLKIGHFFSFMR